MIDIKLIDENTDLSKAQKQQCDSVYGNTKLDVYCIPGYVHTIGGHWGENDYWCCPRGEKPTYENLMEFGGNRVNFGFTIEEFNSLKSKWGETEIRNHVRASILRNGELFLDFGCNDMTYAVSKAQQILFQIKEHPLDFYSQNWKTKMIGDKIWWREQPAEIVRWVDGQGCIIIKPDGIKYFKTPKYFENEDGNFYTEDGGEVKIDVFEDKHVWWFR